MRDTGGCAVSTATAAAASLPPASLPPASGCGEVVAVVVARGIAAAAATVAAVTAVTVAVAGSDSGSGRQWSAGQVRNHSMMLPHIVGGSLACAARGFDVGGKPGRCLRGETVLCRKPPGSCPGCFPGCHH